MSAATLRTSSASSRYASVVTNDEAPEMMVLRNRAGVAAVVLGGTLVLEDGRSRPFAGLEAMWSVDEDTALEDVPALAAVALRFAEMEAEAEAAREARAAAEAEANAAAAAARRAYLASPEYAARQIEMAAILRDLRLLTRLFRF